MGNLVQNVANAYRALWIRLILNPKNCLDVGCGTGRLVYWLRRFGIKAYGVDVSSYALEVADREIKPYVKFGNITDIPYKNNGFDLVVTFDVLEHLERSQLQKSIKETIRVSKKWILHKVYTKENHWISLSHEHDHSHRSVMSEHYWLNLFKYIDNIAIIRNGFFKFSSFFETVFLLRKK